MKKPAILIAASSITLLLGACETSKTIDNGNYWQRTNASDAAYTNGAKAQERLNHNIAFCTAELDKLEQLGQYKNTVNRDALGNIINPNENVHIDYDALNYDSAYTPAHGNYSDFETCMGANGWERVTTVNYGTAQRATRNYRANHMGEKEKAAKRTAYANQTTDAQEENYND